MKTEFLPEHAEIWELYLAFFTDGMAKDTTVALLELDDRAVILAITGVFTFPVPDWASRTWITRTCARIANSRGLIPDSELNAITGG